MEKQPKFVFRPLASTTPTSRQVNLLLRAGLSWFHSTPKSPSWRLPLMALPAGAPSAQRGGDPGR
jgi:hypothetical protein